ncbi:hypothetical protein ABHC52_09300 [Ruminococcus bicirculans (ex Wegman et al. 2014)]|uniref:cobaltochelatase CobT-related protein n=1 Tax=Ruminococcus bicirculans (ex Wegman et al. 2014) TaxID=1160721 RepID=UPI00325BBCA4
MYGHSVKEISDKIRAEGSKITESVLLKSRAVSTALTNVSQYLFDTIPFKKRKKIVVTANYDKKNNDIAYATSTSNIYVNFGNSFLDKDSKGKKITTAKKWLLGKGLILHEIGHLLFTNFNDMANFQKVITAEQWNWQRPIKAGVSPDFNEKLKEVEAYLNLSSQNEKQFMTAFHDFNNIIEDGYIEEKLMKSFKGDFVASLYELRDFQYDEFPTIENVIESGRSSFSIWQLMMLSYAKYGLIKVKDNNTYGEPLVRKFCEFLPSITDCVTEDNSYVRLDKSLTLFVDMWDVIKEELVNITDEAYTKMMKALEMLADSMGAANQRGQAIDISQIKDSSDSSENSLNRKITQLLAAKQKSTSNKSNPESSDAEETSASSVSEQGSEQEDGEKSSDSSSGSTDNKSEGDNPDTTEGKSASSASEQGSVQEDSEKSSDSSSGSTDNKSEGDNSDTTEGKSASSANEQGSKQESNDNSSSSDNNQSENDISDNVADYDSLLKTLSKELKEVKAEKEEDMQKAEQKAEQDISATKQNVAQDRVTEQARNEARQADEQMINSCIMDGPHAKVTYRLHDFSPASCKEAYVKMNNTYSLERIGKKMAQKVKPIFEKKIKGAVYHGQHCGSRISIPHYQKDSSKPFDRIKKPEKISLSCTVIIDQSGSMYGYKLESALRAAAIIKNFCNELKIPTMVFGHSSSYPTMDIYRFCEFDGSEDEIYTLAAGNAHCGTRDGAALLYAVNKLKDRREEKKIIFIISDGSPCDYGYSGITAYKDIQGIIKSASAYGISFFAAAIDEDKESIAKIYGEDRFVDISNLDDLPSKMAYVLKRALKIR